MKLDQREIEECRRAVAVAKAIGSIRMEGLDVDAPTRGEMDRAALGELEPTDEIASIRRRAIAGEFRTALKGEAGQ